MRSQIPGEHRDGHPVTVLTRPFVFLWITSLATFFGVQLLTASLPLYAITLGADDAVLGLLTGFIASVALVTRPLVGWWVDRSSATPPLVAGCLIFTVCALGYWLAATVPALLVLRAVTGLAIACFGTASQALAANLAPMSRRGEALSLFALATTISQGLAPAAGIGLVRRADYPTLFLVCFGLNLAGAVLAWGLHAQRADTAAGTHGRVLNRSVLVPGVLLAGLTVAYGVNISLLAVHASRRGLGNPGLVFLTHAAGILAAQSFAGRVSDRSGRLAVIAPGLLVSAVGMWAASALSGAGLLLAAGLMGMGLGAAQPALYALAVDLVPVHERGSAVGTIGIFHEIGISLGAIGGGYLGRSVGLGAMYALAGLIPASAAGLALVQGDRRRALRR